MTQVTRQPNEMFEDRLYEDWQEWKDGDDSALYDSGYYDGLIKAVEVLDSVRAQPEVDRLPSGFTVSVVIATLREIAKGK
jgi:3',5'-cyclic AMP phosphodiesterase CpdA